MRQHVTREQMKRLEAGEIVILNLAQVEELEHYAPSWVAVYVNQETSAGFGQYNVIIKDTRQAPAPDLKQQLKDMYLASELGQNDPRFKEKK